MIPSASVDSPNKPEKPEDAKKIKSSWCFLEYLYKAIEKQNKTKQIKPIVISKFKLKT